MSKHVHAEEGIEQTRGWLFVCIYVNNVLTDISRYTWVWWLPVDSHSYILYLVQESANFLGSRAGCAPDEFAAGRSGKFYVKKIK